MTSGTSNTSGTRDDSRDASGRPGSRPDAFPVSLPAVLPSLLLCDFGNLANEVRRLENAGAKGLHLDVMDGRFVPQLSYGPVVVEAVRRASARPIDVHLMIEDPASTIGQYLDLGVDCLTVHVEAVDDVAGLLDHIRSRGALAHLSLNPGTPLARIQPFLGSCDGVLVMSVEPGFGGQAFMPVAIEKLAALAEIRRRTGARFRIAVDGGISQKTVEAAAKAGAELLVAGSAIVRAPDYGAAIRTLEHLAREAA